MTIYYRKVYEQHFGPIPREENGRTYEIHHIDGNHKNNDPTNLTALTIQQHYDVHYQQGDWGACLLISRSMTVSPAEKSILASCAARARVVAGTHHFIGGAIQQAKIADGTHQFLDKEWQREATKKTIESGKHNFLGGELQRNRLENGTHHFLGNGNPVYTQVSTGTHPFLGGDVQRATNNRLLSAGTHSTQWAWKCDCGKEGKGRSNLGQHQRGTKCPLTAKTDHSTNRN